MRARVLALALAANAAHAPPAAAGWAAEARLGGAWNLPLPLTVRQVGEPELKLMARWSTRAFQFPLYYVARVSRWEDGGAWALDLTHHKIHLESPPPDISEFAVSHGYNLITIQRLIQGRSASTGLGAGMVVAHPENQVRGRRLDETQGILGRGDYIGGPSFGVMTGSRGPERHGLFANAEVRVTVSWARLPVANGTATVPNVALHATVGLGWAARR